MLFWKQFISECVLHKFCYPKHAGEKKRKVMTQDKHVKTFAGCKLQHFAVHALLSNVSLGM